MLHKIQHYFWGLRYFERLLKVPRQYANVVDDPRDVDRESAIIMARSYARSPENAQQLMAAHEATSALDLVNALPDNTYRPNPRRQLVSMLRRITGASYYNPDTSRRRQLVRSGYFAPEKIKRRVARALDALENDSA